MAKKLKPDMPGDFEKGEDAASRLVPEYTDIALGRSNEHMRGREAFESKFRRKRNIKEEGFD